jgi:hypothetical protein
MTLSRALKVREQTGKIKIDPYTYVHLLFDELTPKNLLSIIGLTNTRNKQVAYHALRSFMVNKHANNAHRMVMNSNSNNKKKVHEAKKILNNSKKTALNYKKYFESYSNQLLHKIPVNSNKYAGLSPQ